LFHSWCAAASLVKRRPQVPLPVVRKRCRRRYLATVQKAVSISRPELGLIGDPLRGRCHSRRQQLMRLNIRPACQSRLLPNRRHLRPAHGPAFTSGLGPASVVLNHKTGKPTQCIGQTLTGPAACLPNAVIAGHGDGRHAAGNSTRRFTPAGFFICHAPARGVPKVIPHRAFPSGIPAWNCRLLRPRQAF
jgi:hypothetical protein